MHIDALAERLRIEAIAVNSELGATDVKCNLIEYNLVTGSDDQNLSHQDRQMTQSRISDRCQGITRLVIRDEVVPTEMNSLVAKIKVGNLDPLED